MTVATVIKGDTQLKADVESELKFEPRVNPNDIGVTVRDGIVTLAGFVTSFLQRSAAEQATHRVYGVKAVANDLEVRLAPSFIRTDADLAAAAVNALKWDVMVNATGIEVTVSKGWVTLTGKVDWMFEKQDATRLMERLTGVKGVTNLLVVKPHVVPSELKAKIEQALVRSAATDASRIKVAVDGGKVTLTGAVRTYAEMQDAERAAWAVPGVTSVDDHLSIAY
jgi:osmotically-inducible protein OsmY